MREQTIAAITRHAAASISRRASLFGLGGAALAAAMAGPSPAKAGKAGKKAKKKCKRQIGQCESSIAAFCAEADVEGCEDTVSPCCGSFRNCQAGDAYECIVDALLTLGSQEPV